MPIKTSLTKYPHLLREWHPTKNKGLSPEKITHGSKKNVWWQCNKADDHEWQAQVSNRTKTKNPSGCPFCLGRKASKANNLVVHHPELIEEWHPTKNGIQKPQNFTRSSHSVIWWRCKTNNQHVWESSINRRTSMKTGCPYCANKRVNKTNSLGTVAPEIASQWHPTLNADATPDQYTPGSHKSIWWLCKLGHRWKTTIKSRTSKTSPTGCPFCSTQTSRPEIRLFCELNWIFPDAIWRHKIDKTEVDVFIPSLRVAVEYDGSYFHQDKIDRDKAKNDKLKTKGIFVIRLRERPLTVISSLDTVTESEGIKKNDLNNLLLKIPHKNEELLSLFRDYQEKSNFQSEQAYKQMLSQLPYPPIESSLAGTHKELIKEWDSERNTPLVPESFSYGSHYDAWWICRKGHSYQAQIQSRTAGSGCPICSKRIVTQENNLSITHPKLAMEWHPENKRPPSEFTSGNDYKAKWRCSKNPSHEWQTSIRVRTRSKKPTGCPYCAGRLADKENNLLAKYPEIAREWHYKKNNDLAPDTVTPRSDQKVWWICLKHKRPHEWEAQVKHRTGKGSGCPICSKLKVAKSHKIKIQQIDVNGHVVRSWDSVRECADTLTFEVEVRRDSIERGIAKVCRKERNSYKKMMFQYVS